MRDQSAICLYTAVTRAIQPHPRCQVFFALLADLATSMCACSPGGTCGTLVNYAPFTPNTFGASPVDRPCQVQITDGSGTLFAEIDTYYDGGTTLCGADGSQAVMAVNGLPTSTHDTNYGVNAASRGNATTVSRKCLLNCTTSASTTTATYDETGQVISNTDPCGTTTCGDMTGTGHTTTYSYTDSPLRWKYQLQHLPHSNHGPEHGCCSCSKLSIRLSFRRTNPDAGPKQRYNQILPQRPPQPPEIGRQCSG